MTTKSQIIQPMKSVSHSETSYEPEINYKPRYFNNDSMEDEKNLNSTIDHQSNKLPVNLFHSAADYTKMIITYGKNRKKTSSQITDGIITSLEYVNDKIFDQEIQIREKAK